TRLAPFLGRPSGVALVALASVCACGLLVAGATAVTLPPGDVPLLGSSFQGGDGNQDNQPQPPPPRIDWQALQAAGRVHHSPDSNDQHTPLLGGSKKTG